MIHGSPMVGTSHGALLCQGACISDKDRVGFLLRNGIENITGVQQGDEMLYDSMGFPFKEVENVLSSSERVDFLYILVNSPLNANLRVYDEFVYKNFPCTTQLLKQIRDGGDMFVYKKSNRDVLFVKFHNIYEDEPLLRIRLF